LYFEVLFPNHVKCYLLWFLNQATKHNGYHHHSIALVIPSYDNPILGLENAVDVISDAEKPMPFEIPRFRVLCHIAVTK
jgi:hypothetical protein